MGRVKKEPVKPIVDSEIIKMLNEMTGRNYVENLDNIFSLCGTSYAEAREKDYKWFKKKWDAWADCNFYPIIDEETQRKELFRPSAFRLVQAFYFCNNTDAAFHTFIIPKVLEWIEQGKGVRDSGIGCIAIEGDLKHEINEYRNQNYKEHESEFDGYSNDILSCVKRFAIIYLEQKKHYDLSQYPQICEGIEDEMFGRRAGYLQINRCNCSEMFPELKKYEKGSGDVGTCNPE